MNACCVGGCVENRKRLSTEAGRQARAIADRILQAGREWVTERIGGSNVSVVRCHVWRGIGVAERVHEIEREWRPEEAVAAPNGGLRHDIVRKSHARRKLVFIRMSGHR